MKIRQEGYPNSRKHGGSKRRRVEEAEPSKSCSQETHDEHGQRGRQTCADARCSVLHRYRVRDEEKFDHSSDIVFLEFDTTVFLLMLLICSLVAHACTLVVTTRVSGEANTRFPFFCHRSFVILVTVRRNRRDPALCPHSAFKKKERKKEREGEKERRREGEKERRRKEKGGRRKEEGGRRKEEGGKEKGERRKEKGGRRKEKGEGEGEGERGFARAPRLQSRPKPLNTQVIAISRSFPTSEIAEQRHGRLIHCPGLQSSSTHF